MNNSGISSVVKKAVLIWGIAFVVFNLVVFALCGFSGHTSTFWMSYLFMDIAFFLSALCGLLLKDKAVVPKDWLFGFAFYKHCTFYLIAQFIATVLFMWKDESVLPSIAFSVQIIILAVFSILITLCFLAKDHIEDVEVNVKTNTAFMKMLLADAETVAGKISDANVKKAFLTLCDDIRYSDPVSSDLLADIENRLAAKIDQADSCINCNDNAAALECCKQAMQLLSERNRKCKMLKA